MTIVQLVAAIAACVAVYFAYRGVEITADTLRQSREAQDADEAARAEANAREMALRRLDQLEAISSQIIRLREVAQSSIEPQNRPQDRTGSELVMTQIPILQSRLKISLCILSDLGAPELEVAREIVDHSFNWGTDSHVWLSGKAVDAISEIHNVLVTDSKLAMPT